MTTIPAERILRPGDLILVDLDPVLGTEQRGRRPALIISTIENEHADPADHHLSDHAKSSSVPTKVLLPDGLGTIGAILVDQARSIDRKARTLRFLGTVPDLILKEVRSKLAALIGVPVGDAAEASEPP